MKNLYLLSTPNPSRVYKINSIGKLDWSEGYLQQVDGATNQNIYITNSEEIKEGDWFIDDKYKQPMKYFGEGSLLKSSRKIILTTDRDLIENGVQSISDEFLEWFVKSPSCGFAEYNSNYNRGNGKTYYKIIIPKEEPKQLFTDYPIIELGDNEFVEAPIRECKLISYDNNKYCYVKVEGIEKEIKRCYIYPQKGRCGKVDCISFDEIKELLKEEPKQETLEEAAEIELGKLAIQNSKKFASKSEVDYTLGFIQGAKWQQEQDKKLYCEEDMYWAMNMAKGFTDSGKSDVDINNCFEKFKKK